MGVTRLVSRILKSGPDDSSLRWRLASGVFWVLAAAIVSQASGLLRAILPARILGVSSYGQFVTIQSTLGLVASFAGLGIGTTATRYIAQLRQTDPKRVGRILGFCNILTVVTAGLFSIILLLFARIFSGQVFGSDALASELRIGVLYVFFFTINGYQMGALTGFEAFSSIAWATVLQSLLSVAVTLVLTWLAQLPGAVLALGVSALIAWGIQGVVLRNRCASYGIQITYSNALSERRIFNEFALPAAISGVLGGLVVAGGNAILVRQPDGLAQAAIFSAATTIRTIVLFAPGLLTRVTLPMLSSLQHNQTQSSFRKTFFAGFVLSTGFSLLTALVLVAGAPFLLHLFGDEYAGGRIVVVLALASAVVEIVGVNLFQVLYSCGKIWTHLAIVSSWTVIILGGVYFWAPEYGAAALAFSYLIAWLSSAVLYSFVARAILKDSADGQLRTEQ